MTIVISYICILVVDVEQGVKLLNGSIFLARFQRRLFSEILLVVHITAIVPGWELFLSAGRMCFLRHDLQPR